MTVQAGLAIAVSCALSALLGCAGGLDDLGGNSDAGLTDGDAESAVDQDSGLPPHDSGDMGADGGSSDVATPDAGPEPCTEPGCILLSRTPEPNVRLVVMWLSLHGNVDPIVVLDVAAPPAGEAVVVGRLQTPPDTLLLCERACGDPLACDCMGEFRVGVGLVLLVRDQDTSGAIEADEYQDIDAIAGAGQCILGHRDDAGGGTPIGFESLFPRGIEQGMWFYELVVVEGRDALGARLSRPCDIAPCSSRTECGQLIPELE